jgi:uncharacterized protein (DUF433 family)
MSYNLPLPRRPIVQSKDQYGTVHVVKGTEIAVWTIIVLMRQGGLKRVLEQLVALNESDVAEALFWALGNRRTINAELKRHISGPIE